MKRRKLIFTGFLLVLLFSACSQSSQEMQDGYYTAEEDSFNKYGWKEFVTIYVSGGKILTVEYDAYNASGLARSWDINYMRTMNIVSGTYPNEFTRAYAVSLLNWQEPDKIDAISGATSSYNSFQMLAKAAIAQAKAGDKQVALIESPEAQEETEG